MSVSIWTIPVFAFGVLAALIDIDAFFRNGRIGYVVRGNVRFWLFVLLNGAIAAVVLVWALLTDPHSLINQVIQVDSAPAKMFVIGFGVPLLLRSKLFAFGQDQTAAGPAIAYDWFRFKTLRSINEYSARVKNRLAERLAPTLAKNTGTPTRIKDLVDDYVRPLHDSRSEGRARQ